MAMSGSQLLANSNSARSLASSLKGCDRATAKEIARELLSGSEIGEDMACKVCSELCMEAAGKADDEVCEWLYDWLQTYDPKASPSEAVLFDAAIQFCPLIALLALLRDAASVSNTKVDSPVRHGYTACLKLVAQKLKLGEEQQHFPHNLDSRHSDFIDQLITHRQKETRHLPTEVDTATTEGQMKIYPSACSLSAQAAAAIGSFAHRVGRMPRAAREHFCGICMCWASACGGRVPQEFMSTVPPSLADNSTGDDFYDAHSQNEEGIPYFEWIGRSLPESLITFQTGLMLEPQINRVFLVGIRYCLKRDTQFALSALQTVEDAASRHLDNELLLACKSLGNAAVALKLIG